MIFIGGIHGVGKTTLIKELAKNNKLSHYSSSDLISKQKQKQFDSNKKN